MIHNDKHFGYGSSNPNSNGHNKERAEEVVENGLTLVRYAEANKLPVDFLKSINVKNATYDFSPAIRIPYPDELGREQYHRYRIALKTEPRFQSPSKGTGAKPIPYGLQTLPLAREKGYVWIPEGESDTQILWYLDQPSLGIPGVEAWSRFGVEWAKYLHNIPVLLVPVEYDHGGEKLWTLLSSTEDLQDRLYRVDLTSPAFNDIGDLWVDAVNNGCEKDLKGALQGQVYVHTRAHSLRGPPQRRSTKRTIRAVSFTGRPAPKPREWIVENVIPKGHATSWYGAGGTAKTYLALHFALSVASPQIHTWAGMPVTTTPVVYADFEFDQDEHERRTKELLEGMGLDDVPDNFYYMNVTGVSSKEGLAIGASECDRLKAGLFILDSVGYALAGDLSESRDVIRFFRQEIEAIKAVGATPHLIDHQAKVVKGEKYSDKQEFGSVYKTNSVRASFQLRGEWNENTVVATFTHKKANMGRFIDPFSMRLTFEGGKVKVEKLDSALPDPDHQPTAKEQMLAAWEELEEATCSTVAKHTDLDLKTVRNQVSDLCNAGWLHKTDKKEGKETVYAFGSDKEEDEGDEELDDASEADGVHDDSAVELITDQEGVDTLADTLRESQGLIALDTETSSLEVHKAEVRLMQFKVSEGDPQIVDCLSGVDVSSLLDAIRDRHLLGHNLAYDLAVLHSRHGYVHEGLLTDTHLMFQVFYGGMNKKSNLKDALSTVLGVEISKDEQASDWMGELTPEMLSYASEDVAHLHDLAEALREKIEEKAPHLWPVVALEHDMAKVTAHMKSVGMAVDEKVWTECVEESRNGADERLAELDAFVSAANMEIPENFIASNTKNKNVPESRNSLVNWNSHPQKLWVFKELFGIEEAGGKPLKKTDKDVMALVNHPAAVSLIEYRKVLDVYQRFRATQIVDGRVYGDWNQLKARTGRMSCSRPPLQGIPDPLRKAFVAPKGHKLIVSDLSQIEVRVLAVVCSDENLREDLKEGVDVHRRLAANVFDKSLDEVTDKERKLVKSLVFGTLYGMGLPGFTARVNSMTGQSYTTEEVQSKFRGPLFGPYPKVQAWMDKVAKDFEDGGKRVSYTLLGRRRLQVPDVPAALNTPIQAGALDVMKAIATHAYATRKSGWKIVALVHDEILIEVPENESAEAREWIHQVMIRVGTETLNHEIPEDQRVSVDASAAICETWEEKE